MRRHTVERNLFFLPRLIQLRKVPSWRHAHSDIYTTQQKGTRKGRTFQLLSLNIFWEANWTKFDFLEYNL